MMKPSRRARTCSAFPDGQSRKPLPTFTPVSPLAIFSLWMGEAPCDLAEIRHHVVLHRLDQLQAHHVGVLEHPVDGEAQPDARLHRQVHVLGGGDPLRHDVHALPDHGVLDAVAELARHVLSDEDRHLAAGLEERHHPLGDRRDRCACPTTTSTSGMM